MCWKWRGDGISKILGRECEGMKILFSWIRWISEIQNYIVQKEESKIFQPFCKWNADGKRN